MSLRVRALAALCLALLATPHDATADVTAFLGLSPTPGAHLARGVSGGFGFIVVAFEVEVARLTEQEDDERPGLTTGMGNLLVQTPLEVSRTQFYATTGIGIYRERLSERQATSVAANLGGGLKIRVAGPLKLRLDYRLFRLRGDPLHDTYHRLYAGATLGF
jgi:hypothetical protein